MKHKLDLTAKTTSKLTLKHTLFYTVVGLGIMAILFTGAFLYFNLGNSEEAVANKRGYTSRDNHEGLWSDPNIWTREGGGVTAPVPDRGYGGITIDIYGMVTDNTPPRSNYFNGSAINILDTLIIKGDLILSGGRGFNVSSNGILIVFGNAEVKQGAHITNNNGRIVITGDLTTSGGSRVNNNSNGFYIYGNAIEPQWESLFHGNSFKNETDLRNNDPSLYDFVGNGGSLLPIVLSDFQASLTNSQTVQVEWSTFSEKNNDFFTVERSADGKNFEVLTTVAGAGNSNKKSHYSFEDKHPLAGYNYYRLKQTDFNGDFEYFKIVGVNNAQSKAGLSTSIHINDAWPNPFTDHLNISFDADGDGEVEIFVRNIFGEVVHQTGLQLNYGENKYAFDRTESLKPGVYFVTIDSKGKKFTQKVIKI